LAKQWENSLMMLNRNIMMLSDRIYKDFRNLLVHEYFGVDLEIVWKVIRDDLPGLLKSVEQMMRESGYFIELFNPQGLPGISGIMDGHG
jgi:hypothetical protein